MDIAQAQRYEVKGLKYLPVEGSYYYSVNLEITTSEQVFALQTTFDTEVDAKEFEVELKKIQA